MDKEQRGPNNHNWKGGKIISTHGYALVRVGTNHHLSDVRGYAYEHRIVAEQLLGRRLEEGELVHHKDGNKTNNHPSNLEVVSSIAEHFVHHRYSDNRRLPNQPNPMISCECGCGRTLAKFDNNGRPRRFINGHNPQPAPTRVAISNALEKGPRTLGEIAEQTGLSKKAIKIALTKMVRAKDVQRPARGVYEKHGQK